jgi:hypothetical protein
MGARLSFLRRAEAEVRIHGGEVYYDINGRNVGKLLNVDSYVDLPAGTYQIRMYQSHQSGSLIGFAEATVTLQDGDDVMVRYAPPVTVTQPGNIILSDYSVSTANGIIADMNRQINTNTEREQKAAETSQRNTKKIVTWIVIGAVVTGILWGLVYVWILWPIL